MARFSARSAWERRTKGEGLHVHVCRQVCVCDTELERGQTTCKKVEDVTGIQVGIHYRSPEYGQERKGSFIQGELLIRNRRKKALT